MHLLDPRAALLANAEVLALLRELDADHVARAKSAVRIKKEDDAAGRPPLEPLPDDVSENLRTVELEAIQYLSADYHPTSRQSSHAISQLLHDLAPFSLTKAEKLQVVNLAPTEPVELYVIVEELEDRLGDRMDEILAIVSASLSHTAPTTPAPGASSANAPSLADTVDVYDVAQGWELDADDAEFDDFGEGIGIEGDLDMEDE